MEKTGKILKEQREKKGYTLNEIAVSTKISPRILKAIEEGIDEDLPPRTFLRGMIQSYARFLKMDPTEVLRTFKEEYDSGHYEDAIKEEDTATMSNEAPAPIFTEILSNKAVIQRSLIVVGVLVAIAVVYSLKGVVDKYEKESQITKTKETIKNIEPLKQEKPKEKKVEAAKKEEPKKEPTPAAKKEPEKKEEPKVEKKPEPVVAAKPPEKKEEKKEEPKVEPKKEETKPVVAGSPQEVIIEALDSVTIDFRIDGGQLKTVNLKPDEIHTIKAKSKVAMDLSDGGVVNIIQNGKDKGVPGDLGKPIKIKFP